MNPPLNELGQPIGIPLENWAPCDPIPSTSMHGLCCTLERLDLSRHADSLNIKSRQAAERLGFTFEGIFRQAVVYKNRNRDTA